MLQQYKKIMVAVDGSEEAELAFQKAVNVAIRNNGELLLAHVIILVLSKQSLHLMGCWLSKQLKWLNKLLLIMKPMLKKLG